MIKEKKWILVELYGGYAVRSAQEKGFGGYQYPDPRGGGHVWDKEHHVMEYCVIKDKEEATKLLNKMNDISSYNIEGGGKPLND